MSNLYLGLSAASVRTVHYMKIVYEFNQSCHLPILCLTQHVTDFVGKLHTNGQWAHFPFIIKVQ